MKRALLLLGIALSLCANTTSKPIKEFDYSHIGFYCDHIGRIVDDAKKKGWKLIYRKDLVAGEREYYSRDGDLLVIDIGPVSECVVQKYRNGVPLLKRWTE